MGNLAEVNRLAESLIDQNLDSAPRFRLYRDVLRLSSNDARLVDCQQAALNSKWIRELENDQESNGIWGRFHTQDTSIRRRFPTSEIAIRRALALGLDKDSALLKKAIGYMERHLQGLEVWSDPPEKHEGWPVNIRFVTAGTLAKVDPNHPLLDDLWALWAEIARRVFHSGQYDTEAERQAHKDLNGIVTRNKYVKLWMAYPLLILSSTHNRLPIDLEQALLDWLWHNEEGIYYIYSGCLSHFPPISARPFAGWLEALEVLSNFSRWREVAGDAVAWIWEQRNGDGWWDFGPGNDAHFYFPLSDSWRKPLNRQIDSSTRVLALLRRYYDT